MTFYYLAFDPFCAEVGYGIYVKHDVICDEYNVMLPTTLWEEEALAEFPVMNLDDVVETIVYSEVVI